MAREQAYSVLMRGIDQLDFQDQPVPSDLVLTGDRAFPLVMNQRGQVLMAASGYGDGRIVVLGHESQLIRFPSVVRNALIWLQPAANPLVGVHPACGQVAGHPGAAGVQVEVGAFRDTFGVYVTDAYSVGGSVKEMVNFLKSGGGLLVAGQAWSWAEEDPNRNALRGFPGNDICSVAGIFFSEHKAELGVVSIPKVIPSSWLSVAIDKDFTKDLEFLLEGVSEFDIQGGALPSEILVHGLLAFPIGATDDGRAFFAGAYYGQGRVIVGTHEGYLSRPELERFLINAVRWLDEGRGGRVGVQPQLGSAHSLLSKSGLSCERTDFTEGLSVYVCTSYSDDNCAQLQEHVAEGSGLLIAGHAWYWAQSQKDRNVLVDYPGNRILNKMGLSLLGSTVSPGLYKVIPEMYHFRRLLRRFAAHVTNGEELMAAEQQHLKKLGQDCTHYLHMQAHDCHDYSSILNVLTDMVKQNIVPQVHKKCPVSEAKDHLLLNLSTQLYKVSPQPDDILPYIIKEKPNFPVVSNSKILIVGNAEGEEEWKSTGLYLSAGMRTYISVPARIVGKGWRIQVGCQTDNIAHADELKRAPVVHERYSVDSEMMLVSNLWGGLLYLVAPPKSQEGELEVVVQLAVLAPYFRSGETSVQHWVSVLRNAPAPWAELEFENIILTVPSKLVRNLDRPDEVAVLWDSIMKSVAELASVPSKFPRKERIVGDVQISHGFMHAGYPIMMQASSAADLLNPEAVRANGIWGSIHELGHNQQRYAWEFPPHTTECTCNLWSIYVHETVLGIPKHRAHEAVTTDSRKRRLQEYVKGGKNLNSWQMWTALETYMQLQEAFGWEAFKKVFAAYHNINGVPGDNSGRMNLYVETFSSVVNKNLVPFFKAWGWPISPGVEGNLAGLPSWGDHPMEQYT